MPDRALPVSSVPRAGDPPAPVDVDALAARAVADTPRSDASRKLKAIRQLRILHGQTGAALLPLRAYIRAVEGALTAELQDSPPAKEEPAP